MIDNFQSYGDKKNIISIVCDYFYKKIYEGKGDCISQQNYYDTDFFFF